MHDANVQKAWEALKTRPKESRIAFIAALLMAKVPPVQSPYAIEKDRDMNLTPDRAEALAAELCRLAGRIKAEAEAACSYERSPAQERADERNREKFHAIGFALGFEVETGGDPRGPVCRLIDPDDRKGDGWGEGWAVYA